MKKTLLIVLGIIIVMQFFRIDTTNPSVDSQLDFITITKPEAEIEAMLRNACYDCHSFETNYPWYAQVAPVSWWVGHHIDEGREELNFSEWGNYDAKKADHKLEECAEEVEARKMPLGPYILTHDEAVLSKEEKEKLAAFFQDLREQN